jgi:hypothetical protein
VAHYDAGSGVDGFSDAAVVPEVDLWRVRMGLMGTRERVGYIATAYADVGDADEDIVGIEEFWEGFIFYFCRFGGVEDD